MAQNLKTKNQKEKGNNNQVCDAHHATTVVIQREFEPTEPLAPARQDKINFFLKSNHLHIFEVYNYVN